jgi:hypothetical protein
MVARLEPDLKVEFILLPPEREPAWRAGLLLLIQFMVKDCDAAIPIQIEEFITAEVT